MNKLIVLLLLLFTTSCTVTMNYKSSKLRKSHSKIYLQVQKLSKSMTKDLIKRKKLYNSLNLENNNKSIKFQNIFNEMSIIIEDTKKEELIALRIKNDVYVLTNKRK
jgi:hypothetical protein